MDTRQHAKLKSRRGMSWLIAILLVAIIVLSVVIAIPSYLKYKRQADALACATSLDTARRQLAADFMFNSFENEAAEHAKDYAAFVMNGWEDICPAYGSVYIIRRSDESMMDWDIYCGLHGSDRKLCTRLNAEYTLDQLREALRVEQAKGVEYPESLEYTLHGKTRTAYLVDAPTNLKRGTATTKDYEGIVAYYSLVGHSDYGAGMGEDGTLWYFSYADEEHCANWRSDDGWTGDSYRGQ